MYQHILENGELPPTLQEALISLICKPDKDPTVCGSYRPISLINIDLKILAKILALRLEKVLPTLINTDQTGFIRNRMSSNNFQHLFHIIHEAGRLDSPTIAVSLYAEKAFDHVEWEYLFMVLENFQFGPYFVNWICILTDLNIKGFEIGNTIHKVLLYVDDILLCLTEPCTSLEALLKLIEEFSEFSGYKINWSKSEILPLSSVDHSQLERRFPFKIKPNGIK